MSQVETPRKGRFYFVEHDAPDLKRIGGCLVGRTNVRLGFLEGFRQVLRASSEVVSGDLPACPFVRILWTVALL